MNALSGPQMGTTLYALTNEFLSRRYSFEQLLEQVARRKIGPGLEIVGFQSIRGFPVISNEFAARFKALVAQWGLVPTSLAINADQAIKRGEVMSEDAMVVYHERQIQAAAKLGFPVARYQYGAGPNVIRRLAPLAEELNVKLGLEIHAPHHANHPDVLKFREMYAQVRSSHLGWIPDFSSTAQRVPPSFIEHYRQGVPDSVINLALQIWQEEGDARQRMQRFKEQAGNMGASEVRLNELSLIFPMFGNQPPESWLELVPDVVHIHGKFFGFLANGQEEAIDYARLLPIFRDHGYRGYISSEWEAHLYSTADAFLMIEKHQALCRRILAAA